MIVGEWISLSTFTLSVYGVGQVWLVQMSSYRLWAFVGPREFHDYHAAWWRSIWGVLLAPAVLVLLGSVLMLWWRAPRVPGWAAWLSVALQIALVAGTALWWAPLMVRLDAPDGGLARDRYGLLLATHWLRVAIVTAYALLLLWMLSLTVGLLRP